MTAPDTDTLAGLMADATRGALTIAGPSRKGDYAIITSDRKIVGEAYADVEHAREHDPRRAEAYASLFAYSPFLAAEVIALRTQAAKDKARIERQEAALREAEETLRLVEHPAFPDPAHHQAVKALGLRIGFGALMSTASAAWRETLEADGYTSGGEYVAGPCFVTVASCLAKVRAALEDGE